MGCGKQAQNQRKIKNDDLDSIIKVNDDLESRSNFTDETLTKFLKQDTIVFDQTYSLQDFVNMIDIEKGILKLRALPSGKLETYNPITSNKFDHDINEVPSGVYLMDLRYGFHLKTYKRIEKTISLTSMENLKNQ